MELLPKKVIDPIEELPSSFLRDYSLILIRQQFGEQITVVDIRKVLDEREKKKLSFKNIIRIFREGY